MALVIDSVRKFPAGFDFQNLRPMPWTESVVMCRPDYFSVVDVKNPFMASQQGKVDSDLALRQWENLKAVFERIGVKVHLIPPSENREDMVFCANQTFVGIDENGRKVCVPSHMRHPSRQQEVPAFRNWFQQQRYLVEDIGTESTLFEGGGDALWHPQHGLIWGGVGSRTQSEIYAALSEKFQVPVITLKMRAERFYHLDTCFCLIDRRTVLVYPEAFDEAGLKLIQSVFERVLMVGEKEAQNMACNAAAFFGKYIVIQKGSTETLDALKDLGYEVIEVETSEFMRSGGSVYCLKMGMF